MKRLFTILLSIAIIIGLSACSNNTKIEDQGIPIGTYIMEESEDIMKPIVKLEDKNKFTFNYSPLSSYFAVGSYEEDKSGNLILKTDDGKYQYEFKIEDNTLIFNASESADIPPYADVPDGAIFLQIEEYNFQPSVSIIEGNLITRMYYGPPNYGENPETDANNIHLYYN